MTKKVEEEDFPDDFDIAYAHFASSMGRPEPSNETETGEIQQAVLNQHEYNAFSEFLDHVLVDPNAARKDEVHWLDRSMYKGREPTGMYVSMERAAKGKARLDSDRSAKRQKIADPASSQPSTENEPFVLPTQKMTGLKPHPLLSAANAPTPEPTDEELPKARNSAGQRLQEVLSRTSAPLQPYGMQPQSDSAVHRAQAAQAQAIPAQGPSVQAVPARLAPQATAASMSNGPGPNGLSSGSSNRPSGLPNVPSSFLNSQMTQAMPAHMAHMAMPMGPMGPMGQAGPTGVTGQPNAGAGSSNNMLSLHAAASSDFYRGFVEPPKIHSAKGVDDLIQAYKVAQWHNSIMSVQSANPGAQSLMEIPASAESPSAMSTRSSEEGTTPGSASTSGARRRRENLSVEEVRNNHIMSEKRRRDHIKQLFSEMCSLVPAISSASSGGSSIVPPKSVVMQTVYKFIIDIADQNRQIRRLLVRAGARTDNIPAYKLAPPLPETAEDKEAESNIY